MGVCCGLGGAFDVGCGLWARTVEGVVGRAKGDGRILGEAIVVVGLRYQINVMVDWKVRSSSSTRIMTKLV